MYRGSGPPQAAKAHPHPFAPGWAGESDSSWLLFILDKLGRSCFLYRLFDIRKSHALERTVTMQQPHFDTIVVGSGPGGATVARELSALGKKVLILEWGPNPVLQGTFAQYFRHQLIPGKSLLISNGLLGMVRGIITGGSSVFYYGTSFKVPEEMLRPHGIDLGEEIKEVKAELPIAPLKDEMMTPMATRIMESAVDLGYDWKRLDKFMFQDRWKPEDRFGYFGDPNDVKWSARMYVQEAVTNGATLVNNAKVKRVIVRDNTAIGVEYTTPSERRAVAFADRTVLAAGGIGSAVIMRNTGFERAGHDFFFDPLITVCGTVDDITTTNEIPMSAGIHMEDQGYVMTDMSLPNPLHQLFAAQVFRPHRMFNQKRTLRIMIKAKDSLGGRLTDGGGVRKQLSAEDRSKLMDGRQRAKRILEKAGATSIYSTWYLAAHPGGTVKVGELVDSNLKTEYQNLYVCDCSVIPVAWGLPPTLTILCLGKRLAKHLGAHAKIQDSHEARSA